MLIGAHAIIFSEDAEADRAFLRDVLALPSVDVGRGWLIFGLPPSEVAVHPAEGGASHELYLMCEDIAQFGAAMRERGIALTPARDLGWGVLSELSLPGGGKLGVYEPRHARPQPVETTPARAKPAASKRKPRARAKKKTPPARKPRRARARSKSRAR